jgi:hypothetical protein
MVAGDEQQTLSVSSGRPTGTRHLPAVGDTPVREIRGRVFWGSCCRALGSAISRLRDVLCRYMGRFGR